jgi:ubiquinone/menaquinone biosynthesis C-methylase UbiE
MLSNQNPSLLYRLIDSWGNYRLFGYIYKTHVRRLRLGGCEKVLDFGSSGAGSRHLARALRAGGSLVCNDISGYWMGIARKRLRYERNVTFLLGQLTEMQLDAGSFDLIHIHYSLHEVPEHRRQGLVNEFCRLLRTGGKVCIKEPLRKGDGMPAAEIKERMKSSGLKELNTNQTKNSFEGIYQKLD